MEICGERIRELEKRMLVVLEERRKMKEKIYEALALEAEDRSLIREAHNQ